MPTYDVSSFVPSWFFGKVTALLHSLYCSLNVFRWLLTSFSVPHYFPLVPVFSHVLARFEDMIQMFLPKGILAHLSLTARKKKRKHLPPSLVNLLSFIQTTLVCPSETRGFVVKCCNYHTGRKCICHLLWCHINYWSKITTVNLSATF